MLSQTVSFWVATSQGIFFFSAPGNQLVNTVLFHSAGERKEEGRPRTSAGKQRREKRERVVDLISSIKQNHWQVSPAWNYINRSPAAGTPRNILAQRCLYVSSDLVIRSSVAYPDSQFPLFPKAPDQFSLSILNSLLKAALLRSQLVIGTIRWGFILRSSG